MKAIIIVEVSLHQGSEEAVERKDMTADAKYQRMFKQEMAGRFRQMNDTGGMEMGKNLEGATFGRPQIILGE